MSFFTRLFGGKAKPVAPARAGKPAEGPDRIRVYDPYGRETFVTREQWRSSVLPGTLQRAWNDPDELYGFIASALNDGFHADLVDAARHLAATDPDRTRGAVRLGHRAAGGRSPG